MSQTPARSRLLPLVDAWFDIVASLLGAQRSITYALLRSDEPTRSAEQLAPVHPVPDGWHGTTAGS